MVLANNIAAWIPSTWGLEGEGINGFFWEKRSWKLTSINGGYSLTSLVVASLVITHLR